jgi:hypothetical protein
MEPRKPILPGLVVVREDLEEVLDALAADILVQSSTCVGSFGDFHLALGYSALVHALIIKLMTDPKYRSIEWTRTHLWTISEPRVPVGHEDHSMTIISDLLIGPSGLPESQVHPMVAHHPEACELYETELREHLGWREKGQDRLDCVVMDGQRAGIMGHEDPAGRLVGVSDDERVVLTNRIICSSRLVSVGLSGESARDTVTVLESGHVVPGIQPVGGTLKWYLDHNACPQNDL